MKWVFVILATILSALLAAYLLFACSMTFFQWRHPGPGDNWIEALGMAFFSLLIGIPLGAAISVSQCQLFCPQLKPGASILEMSLALVALFITTPFLFSSDWEKIVCFSIFSLLTLLHGAILKATI